MNSRLKVLIADCNSSRAAKLSKQPVWAECGFSVVITASDSTEILKSTKNGTELIVCRHEPPKLSAVDMLNALNSGSNTPCVIVISHNSDASLMRECFILGAVDFLSEPLDMKKLYDAVARAKMQLKKSISNVEYVSTVNEYFTELKLDDSTDKFIKELKLFLLDNETTTVTTEYAADHFGFNKDYFGRMFKAKLGMTFGDFYNHFRMRFACRLLRSGRYKVYEVSEMLGFASVDYFSSVFKKTIGKRPSDLKKY